MNSCHSTLQPDRCKHDLIYHSKGNVSWPNVMTMECQYVKQDIQDKGCDGCKEKTILLISAVQLSGTDTRGNSNGTAINTFMG